MIDAKELLGQRVSVTVDRPLGSTHPRHPDIVYTVNYGYVAGIIAGDGMDIDAYVLGPTEPASTLSGIVIAVILREDDCEDKLVVLSDEQRDNDAPNIIYSDDTIRAAVDFQERYFNTNLLLWKDVSNASVPTCCDRS